MDGNFIVAGCLLAAFFAAGILFERWMEFGMGGCGECREEGDEPGEEEGFRDELCGDSGKDAAESGGGLTGTVGVRGALGGSGSGGAGQAPQKGELSVEEQWDNLLRYDGNPKKKKEKGA